MKINIKRVNENAVIPTFAHPTDSGFDLFTSEELILKPKQKGIAKTGLIFELPSGFGIAVRNKSGMTVKGVPVLVEDKYLDLESEEIKVLTSWYEERIDITVYLGTIDEAYRGEVGIMVKNESNKTIKIPIGVKLAQGVIEKIYHCEFVEVDEVNETDRGKGGFGSTGTK